jgi:hypothetical protein
LWLVSTELRFVWRRQGSFRDTDKDHVRFCRKIFRILRRDEKKAREMELDTNSRRRNVHNNNELDVLVTREGLEYNGRILRRAGKQYKVERWAQVIRRN